jgi:ABC-type polysaccharide/polyol phosphate export permease
VTIYGDLFRYRELFANLFRRDLQSKYKGSLLGVAWSLVNPLLLMGIYVIVFSVLLKAVNGIPHYPLYLLSGLTLWVLFASSLQSASRSMLDNANLIKKTRFPRQLVPFSVVATQLVTFLVMLAVLLVVNFVAIPDVRATEWVAIPLAVPFVALVGGIALAISSANVVFRDVEHLVAALLLPWFFLTPVIYELSALPGGLEQHHKVVWAIQWLNFLTPAITAIRDPLWGGTMPSGADVAYLCVAAVVALALGALVFNRVDDQIAVEL